MPNVNFDGSDAARVASMLHALTDAIKQQMVAHNEDLVVQGQTEIEGLYGARLAKHIEARVDPPGASEFARIHFGSTDYRVLGYEFGTRRHNIPTSGNANPVLRFNWQLGLGFYAHVEHPGTRGKNKWPEFVSAMKSKITTEWETALGALMTLDL